MKIYLDDDSANPLLARLLQAEGHHVIIPADVGTAGQKDTAHFIHTIVADLVLLTGNAEDFSLLHKLVLLVGGHHPGIMVVRKDNDRSRDLRPAGIVRAIRNLVKGGVPIADEVHILNHWR